jgi:hypothetical protein
MQTPWLKDSSVRHALRLLKSFRHWTGRDLLSTEGSDIKKAQALFEAPFVVVSHGTEADPILNYGNRAALELWEMTWESFIHTPSRLTAEALERAERNAMLEEVSRKGFFPHYHGVRVSSTGRRFRIEEALVWNLLDEDESFCGQAAVFDQWNYL